MTVAEAKPTTLLLAVQHAARLLRVGGVVGIEADGATSETVAAEAVTAETVTAETGLDLTGEALLDLVPRRSLLLLTGQRLRSLGVEAEPEAVHTLPLAEVTALPGGLAMLADATAPVPPPAALELLATASRSDRPAAAAAIELCKLAGLLPVAIQAPVGAPIEAMSERASVAASWITGYRRQSAASLRPVSEARVPLADAEQVRIVSFRPVDGGPEQYAILVGEPERQAAPLARLHSECFTGDLLGSLRCDCGDQLRGAIRRMVHEGAGVLLYLAQEGRGIGLPNKLRAYMLQDGGLDTVDANHHLGFANDERDFWAAAAMLRQLGIGRVRLLTNNPAKIAQLRDYGIEVEGRVPHIFEANAHNRGYLLTKARRSGHLLAAEDIEPGAGRAQGYRLTLV